jgi:hypothetical protein
MESHQHEKLVEVLGIHFPTWFRDRFLLDVTLEVPEAVDPNHKLVYYTGST